MSNPNPNIATRFKPGQVSNPKGRPKGKTMKEFAREFLLKMSDEEKVTWLRSLGKDIVWKMAEGNPHQSSDTEVTFPTSLIELIKDANTPEDGNKEISTEDI